MFGSKNQAGSVQERREREKDDDKDFGGSWEVEGSVTKVSRDIIECRESVDEECVDYEGFEGEIGEVDEAEGRRRRGRGRYLTSDTGGEQELEYDFEYIQRY